MQIISYFCGILLRFFAHFYFFFLCQIGIFNISKIFLTAIRTNSLILRSSITMHFQNILSCFPLIA